MAGLRVLVGAILAAALVLAFAAPASAHGNRTARVRAFGETSGYLLLPAPRYRLRIVAAGTSSVVKDLGKVRLKGSTSYTAWAAGFLTPNDDDPGFGVFVSVDG